MKLEFLFVPTSDLSASLASYRALGFTEVWREGETTAALVLPGSEVQLMVDANDPKAPVGPVFVVESLATFHADRPESLTVVEEPSEIPGGYQAVYSEPGGAVLYVIDQSTDGATP